MKKALLKDTLREIKQRYSQFLSIVAILALGVGFFVGIRVTGSDMRITADHYFDETKFMDIKLISTLGFDDESIEILKDIHGVQSVYPSISIDTYAQVGENERVIKTLMLPDVNDSVSMNLPVLTQGVLPSAQNECAIDKKLAQAESISVGDIITLHPQEEGDFSTLKYKVTGIVNSPLYIAYDRGYTSIGDGSLSGFAYLSKEAYSLDVYTEAYIRVSGAAELSCYSSKYEQLINSCISSIKEAQPQLKAQRLQAVQAPLQDKLDEARLEYEQGRQEALDEISDAEALLDSAKTKLDAGISEFKRGVSAIYMELDKSQQDYGKDYVAAASELGRIANNYINTQAESLSYAYQQLEDFRVQYPEMEQLYLSQKLALDSSAAELNTKGSQLNAAVAKLQESAEQLMQGEAEYTENFNQFEQKRTEAQVELETARLELDEAQADLDKLSEPTIFVEDRAYITAYAGFLQDSDRIEAIGRVIPVIFYLVAALVSLSAISRMVEEQRVQIGTLKAIGYSPRSIAQKYIVFALLACILGVGIGMVVGFNIIPVVIFDAYRIMYTMPKVIHPFQIEFLIVPLILALICTVFTAYMACKLELRSVPAALMRPASPKAGRRVLLERVGILWRRLSFLQKVTVRNLMRNKTRFWMSVLGIAGCSGLLLVGFGIRDSVSEMASMQFDVLYSYQSEIMLNEDADDEDYMQLAQKLETHEQVVQTLNYFTKTVDAYTEKTAYSVSIVVPQNPQELADFITLRTRKGHEELALSSEGVIISEKLSKLINVSVGEIITVTNKEEGINLKAPVLGITENYLLHYIYIDPDYYAELTGAIPEPSNIMLKLNTAVDNPENSLSIELMELEAVTAVLDLSASRSSFEKMMNSFDLVIWVIIIAAGTLAFVVLFNLSAININERLREIATIKVLGFYDRESTVYVFRENVVLTVLGTLLGLVLGLVMHRFVIITAEIDMVMFLRTIKLSSYFLSVIITFLFALAVNVFVHFKLKKIDMASALKSVE